MRVFADEETRESEERPRRTIRVEQKTAQKNGTVRNEGRREGWRGRGNTVASVATHRHPNGGVPFVVVDLKRNALTDEDELKVLVNLHRPCFIFHFKC